MSVTPTTLPVGFNSLVHFFHNDKLIVESSGLVQVNSGGQVSLLSGAAMQTSGTAAITVNTGGSIAVLSGGSIASSSGSTISVAGTLTATTVGQIIAPVEGSTAAVTGTDTGATLNAYGVTVALINGTSNRRKVNLVPVAGALKHIYCTSDIASSSGGFALDAGATATFDGTNRIIFTGSSVSGNVSQRLTLMGLSASQWSIVAFSPSSTGWVLGATT